MIVAHAVPKHAFIQQIGDELAECQAPGTSSGRWKSLLLEIELQQELAGVCGPHCVVSAGRARFRTRLRTAATVLQSPTFPTHVLRDCFLPGGSGSLRWSGSSRLFLSLVEILPWLHPDSVSLCVCLLTSPISVLKAQVCDPPGQVIHEYLSEF